MDRLFSLVYMAITIGLSLLAAATIGMIVWFRRVSPKQALPERREWSPVDAPPADFASFVGRLRDELDEAVDDSFLIRVVEDGLTIHQATRLRLLELHGDETESTEEQPAALPAPKKRRPSR